MERKQEWRHSWGTKTLKGQLHGRAKIFKGLKMTFKTKILKKKYTTSISIKNTTNFVLTTFLYNDFCFLTALLIAVNFKFVHIFGKGAGAKGGDGGERAKQLW